MIAGSATWPRPNNSGNDPSLRLKRSESDAPIQKRLCSSDCWHLPDSTAYCTEEDLEPMNPLTTTERNDSLLYRKLQPWQTRVLRIYPEDRHIPLVADLLVVDLVHAEGVVIRETEELIPFQALSYTWGSSGTARTMTVNTVNFGITRNLEAALREIRTTDGYTYIWVDAICINQNDWEERAQQVTKMLQIYQKAADVVVWLGEYSDHSHVAFDCFKNLCQLRDDFVQAKGKNHTRACTTQLYHMHQSLRLLVSRPWLRRTWVRQEAYAARKISIRCGREIGRWQDFLEIPDLLVEMETFLKVNLVPHTPHERRDRALILDYAESALSGAAQSWKPPRDLIKVLLSSRDFDVTNVKDTIYAVLGMTGVPSRTSTDTVVGMDEAGIIVDYHRSMSRISQNMTVFLLFGPDRNIRALRSILHCLIRRKGVEYSPSWSMNWRETLCPETDIPLLLDLPLIASDRSLDVLSPFFGTPREELEPNAISPEFISQRPIGNQLALAARLYGHVEELTDYTCELASFVTELRRTAKVPFLDGKPPKVLPFNGRLRFETGKHHRRLAIVARRKERTLALVPATADAGDLIAAIAPDMLPLLLRGHTATEDPLQPIRRIDSALSTDSNGKSRSWISYSQMADDDATAFELHGPVLMTNELAPRIPSGISSRSRGDSGSHARLELMWGQYTSDVSRLPLQALLIS